MLIKYTDKYVKIYFIIKITFLSIQEMYGYKRNLRLMDAKGLS